MKIKVLITGGSGFIGTNLIEYYRVHRSDFELINIDIVRPKLSSHIPYWRKIDIRDQESLDDVFSQFSPTHVVHLAARTDLNGNNISEYDSNTKGVSNLVEVCSKNTEIHRVLFTSSMLVCKLGYQPKHNMDFNPSTVYGESKVLSEQIVRSNNSNYEWCILRPTSIWGPWFGEPYRLFFDMVISGKYFHLGNKSCKKTYGFVENSVYQIDRILFERNCDIDRKVFYIGDYDPYNIEEWANELGNVSGNKINRLPFAALLVAAKFGDLLKKIGVAFPMTSFRLKNMTTDNIVDMSETMKVVPNLPVCRKHGVVKTLDWMKTI